MLSAGKSRGLRRDRLGFAAVRRVRWLRPCRSSPDARLGMDTWCRRRRHGRRTCPALWAWYASRSECPAACWRTRICQSSSQWEHRVIDVRHGRCWPVQVYQSTSCRFDPWVRIDAALLDSPSQSFASPSTRYHRRRHRRRRSVEASPLGDALSVVDSRHVACGSRMIVGSGCSRCPHRRRTRILLDVPWHNSPSRAWCGHTMHRSDVRRLTSCVVVRTLTLRSRHFVQESSCRDCGFFGLSPEPLRCINSAGLCAGAVGPYPPPHDEAMS